MVLSYLVNKAQSYLKANVFFDGGENTILANSSGAILYQGFPAPNENAALLWIEIFNTEPIGGELMRITTDNNFATTGCIVIPPQTSKRLDAAFFDNPLQAINGQLWPSFGSSNYIVQNQANPNPITYIAIYGGIK